MPQRAQSVDVDKIENEALIAPELGRGRLREKEWRPQVAADEILPLPECDFADWRGIKARSVVDQNVEAPESDHSLLDEAGNRIQIGKVSVHGACGLSSALVEITGQGGRRLGRTAMVNHNIGARPMHGPYNRGTNATCSARDQHGLT